MATTQDDIRGWLERGKQEGATHVLVVCDSFSYEDYPVMIMPGTRPRDKAATYTRENMQTVMECYSLALPIEDQLAEHRAFHWD
jgi:hypothetical protein